MEMSSLKTMVAPFDCFWRVDNHGYYFEWKYTYASDTNVATYSQEMQKFHLKPLTHKT